MQDAGVQGRQEQFACAQAEDAHVDNMAAKQLRELNMEVGAPDDPQIITPQKMQIHDR